MEADPAHAQEALEAWQVLEKAFSEGKPGLENSYNEFTLHDGYLDLLKNCDKYWTEFYPQVYCLDFSFKKGDIDYSKRTAAYEVQIRLNGRTQKFRELMNPIRTGLKKAWVGQWKDIPKDYPDTSLAYTASDTYSRTGVATYNGIKKVESNYNRKTKSYKKDVEYHDSYEASWITNEFGSEKYGIIIYKYLLAGIEFNVCDQNGKTLAASPNRILFENDISLRPGVDSDREKRSSKITLKNVNESAMGLIDSGKFDVKITNMYLYYGRPSYNDAIDTFNGYNHVEYYNYDKYGDYYSRQVTCLKSGKFADHLSALSYRNPKVVTNYSGDHENLVNEVKLAMQKAENEAKLAMQKAEDEKYTPLELEGFEFVRGNYIVMQNDKKFVPSFYVDKESLAGNKKISSWNELNEDSGLPQGTLRPITENEFEILKTVRPELKDASYYNYKDYLIVRSASTVTKESLEAENNIPKMEKENKNVAYFSDVQKNAAFTVKGKNLTKEILYAQFDNGQEKFYPASVNAEKTVATFSVPVEKMQSKLYFYLNGKKKDFYYYFSEMRLNPRISQSSFDLVDGAPNLTMGTDCRFENVESAKNSLKFLLNNEEVSIKSIDYNNSIILQTADVMNKAGAYKLELFAGNELAKSWDISVTDVVSDQFEKWRSGQESFEISGTFVYDINKFNGYSDITISKNDNLRDLLETKKIKVIIGENSQEISFEYYSSSSVKMPLSTKVGEYKIFLEIDGEQIESGKTVTITDVVADQLKKFSEGQETLKISGTFNYDNVGYSNLSISGNANLKDLLEAKKVKVIIGENSQLVKVPSNSSCSVKMPLPKTLGFYDIILEIDGEQIKTGKKVTMGTLYEISLEDFEKGRGKVVLEENSSHVSLGQKEAMLKFDFSQVAGIFAKSGVKVEILIEKGSYKVPAIAADSTVSLKIKVPSPKKNGVYDIYAKIDGKTAKVDGKLYVGN